MLPEDLVLGWGNSNLGWVEILLHPCVEGNVEVGGSALVVAEGFGAGSFWVLSDSQSCVEDVHVSVVLVLSVDKHGEDHHSHTELDESASVLTELEGLPVDVASWVLDETEGVLEDSSLVSLVDWLLRASELLQLPVVLATQRSPSHLETLA